MVKVIRYRKEHFEGILGLHKTQDYPDMNCIQKNTLPKIGFIAKEGDTLIAAGFLRKVEGGYAMIDTLVSNAQQSPQMRHDAISKVVSALIHSAKQLKLHGILATSKDKGTLQRAVATGFHLTGETVIALSLEAS